jgi:hypothetical protein
MDNPNRLPAVEAVEILKSIDGASQEATNFAALAKNIYYLSSRF